MQRPAEHLLRWNGGEARVSVLGAAVHDIEVAHPRGGRLRPLAEAPWRGEAGIADDETIPAHLRWLGGEWPCVPFGRTPHDPTVHGFGTDNEWVLTASRPDAVALAIHYPPGHAVARLERQVAGVEGRAALDFTLAIHPRRDAVMPVGLHPILRLPDAGHRLVIELEHDGGRTFPETFEPVSRLALNAPIDSLDRLPALAGPPVSFTDLAATLTEEAFQMSASAGRLTAVYPDDGYRLLLSWDRKVFPSCLFWLSAGGRTARPWGGRFRGLGVEPLNGEFRAEDGRAALVGGLTLRAGIPVETQYRLEVLPQDGLR